MAFTDDKAKREYHKAYMRRKRESVKPEAVKPTFVKPGPVKPEGAPIAWSEGPVGGTRTLTITKGGSVLEVVVDENGRPCTYERK